MMTEERFELLISSNENRLLDFKREQYRFSKGSSDDLSKFIKDIISFCNTIRDEAAYIIIGIEEKNGKNVLIGLNENIDDSILQDKIKDKVYPRPIFSYSTYEYDSKLFGIIEIPVETYSAPITVKTSKLKGLEIGKIYFRRGSSNSEANGIESININEWITSIVPSHSRNQINNTITSVISKISASDYFSPHVSEALTIGKQLDNKELIDYCVFELTGQCDVDSFNSDHRLLDCFISANQIYGTTYSIGTPMSTFWNELRQNEKYWETKINLKDPINQLEAYKRKLESDAFNQFISVEEVAKNILGESTKHPEQTLYIYWGKESLNSLYELSRQRLVLLLMNLIS